MTSPKTAKSHGLSSSALARAVAGVVLILWLVEVITVPVGWRIAAFQPLGFMLGTQILPLVSVLGAVTNFILYRRDRSPGMALALAVPVTSTFLLAAGFAVVMVLGSGSR